MEKRRGVEGRRGEGGRSGGVEERRKGEKGRRERMEGKKEWYFSSKATLGLLLLVSERKDWSLGSQQDFALLYTHIATPLSSWRGAWASWLLCLQFILTLAIMCRGRRAGREWGGGLRILFSPWITVRCGQKWEGR